MNIGVKLTLGFVLVALSIAAVGYFSVVMLQQASLESLGNDLSDDAAYAISGIDAHVLHRIEDLQIYAGIVSLAEQAAQSNRQFDEMPDAQDYIQNMDRAWTAGETTPSIESLLNNEFSRKLSKDISHINEASGGIVYPEVYVTNKYGVVIATTRRTSDYLQADEDWYQAAVAEKESWISEVKYDDSSEMLTIALAVILRDEDGQFVGVFMSELSILEEVEQILKFVRRRSCYRSTEIYLVDRNGRAILRQQPTQPVPSGRDLILAEFGEDLCDWEPVVQARQRGTGYSIIDRDGSDALAVFSRSKEDHQHWGSGWTLVIERDLSEVLGHVVATKNRLLIASLIVTLGSLAAGLFLSRSISRPIQRLTRTASRIAGGDLDARVEKTDRKDELGTLSQTFNRMTDQLAVFRRFVEASSQGLAMADLNRRITYINASLYSLLDEETVEAVLGADFLEYYPPEQRRKLETEILPIVMERGHWVGESALLSRKGRLTPTIQNLFLLRDEQGEPSLLAGMMTDVSGLKQAEEALKDERGKLQRMLQMHDRERQLIAYEIHDGLAQYLAAAQMQFQVFEKLQHDNPEASTDALKLGMQWLDEGLAEARRLIGGLRPPILDESGLVAAVEHLIHDIIRQDGIDIELEVDVQFDRLAPLLENTIFRIVQESLTNARRHSKSDRVRVTLRQRADRVEVEIQDWGAGFDPESVDERGFGLGGIRERARLLDGQATVESTPGQGTRITVELPLIM